MGGKKKLGIKQMEKQQEAQDEAKTSAEKKKEKAPPKERKAAGIIAPDYRDPKIVAEVKKMGVLTPYAVATRYNIRMSAAKDFLEAMEANGAIELVSASHSLKIYKPKAA